MLSILADNLVDSDPDALYCDFLESTGLRTTSDASFQEPATNASHDVVEDGVVTCLSPPSLSDGEVSVGLYVRRDSQGYSTHDDTGSSALPFLLYPPLPASEVGTS